MKYSTNRGLTSKIEKVPRGIRGEKSSKDMASSRNLVSTIGALASPKMGDGTRCPEVTIVYGNRIYAKMKSFTTRPNTLKLQSVYINNHNK